MPDRCTPEYERTLAEMGARLPYRRARALLDDLFPLGTPPVVETIRQRTLQVGARLECQAATPSRSTPAVAAGSITLSIDTGHVRAVPTYQVRTFEIIVARASNDNGKHMVFASMPDEAYHQAQQLRGVLHDLGATQTTPVTILSDGAAGPRAVGEAASLGPTRHVLDCFHLAMRVHQVARAVKGWPDDTAENRAEGARLADIVEAHIRWRLWHGQVQWALDLIGIRSAHPRPRQPMRPPPLPFRRRRCCVVSRRTCPGKPRSSSTMQRPGAVESRSQRRVPKAWCSGCCIAG
jgi:hypothetical protein